MEKLINLLNKFERETFPEEHEYVRFPDGTDDDGGYWYYVEQPNFGEQKGFNYSSNDSRRDNELNQLLIISKEFGFIKWLVENDKINTESGPLYGFHFIMSNRQPYSFYETLLMILAISDTPIEDLISYLHE